MATNSSMDSNIMVIRNRECLLVCISGVLGGLERILSGFEWDFVGKSVDSGAETYGLYVGLNLRIFF
mgnify:CR=1 FL=1